jgi:hypothetical protein
MILNMIPNMILKEARPMLASGERRGCELVMEPEILRKELEARGIVLLGVGRHRAHPEVLIVYLHSNAGQWQDGSAYHEILSVPGVVAVMDSEQSPSILLVTVRDKNDDDENGN